MAKVIHLLSNQYLMCTSEENSMIILNCEKEHALRIKHTRSREFSLKLVAYRKQIFEVRTLICLK